VQHRGDAEGAEILTYRINHGALRFLNGPYFGVVCASAVKCSSARPLLSCEARKDGYP